MTKYAAEKKKIEQEYYTLGVELALTKHASLKGFQKAKNAFLGLQGGGATYELAKPHIRDLLGKSDRLSSLFLDKADLNMLLESQQRNLSKLDRYGLDKLINITGVDPVTREGTEAAIKKLTSKLNQLGPMNSTEEYLFSLPGALSLGAGLGVGTGIYKGLGKLDKKLKLY